MLTRFSPLFACPRPVSISPRFLFIRFKKILCLTVSDLRPPIADPRFTRLRLFVPDSCLSVSELSRPFVRPSLTSVYPSQSSVHPSETYIHPPTLLCLAILGLCPLFPDLCSSITDFCPPRLCPPISYYTYFLLHRLCRGLCKPLSTVPDFGPPVCIPLPTRPRLLSARPSSGRLHAAVLGFDRFSRDSVLGDVTVALDDNISYQP